MEETGSINVIDDTFTTLKNETNIVEAAEEDNKTDNCDNSNRPAFIDLNITKIKVLELPHCHLTDIPIELKHLDLQHLVLAHNQLTRVPLCLYAGLSKLLYLDLSHNFISAFDMEPQCINTLRKLKLNHNSFGNVPVWFLNFKGTNLEEFNYSCNKANHYNYTRNSYNQNIAKIRKLKLRNCQLLDDDFVFLRCFKLLKCLDISNKYERYLNKIVDVDRLFVRQVWKQIDVLKLDNLDISFFPDGVTWLESLRELSVQRNNLSWIPKDIKYLINLEVLNVSCNTLIALPDELVELPRLKEIKAATNSIDKVPDLSSMKELTTIDLYDNYLEEVVRYNADKVRYIDLEYNHFSTEGFSEYVASRDEYRNSNKLCDRLVLVKAPREFYHSPSRSSEETDAAELRVISDQDLDQEDWDLPSETRQTVPDIDSADEEWKADEVYVRRSFRRSVRVYVPDEDWMFEDAE